MTNAQAVLELQVIHRLLSRCLAHVRMHEDLTGKPDLYQRKYYGDKLDALNTAIQTLMPDLRLTQGQITGVVDHTEYTTQVPGILDFLGMPNAL